MTFAEILASLGANVEFINQTQGRASARISRIGKEPQIFEFHTGIDGDESSLASLFDALLLDYESGAMTYAQFCEIGFGDDSREIWQQCRANRAKLLALFSESEIAALASDA